MADFTCSAISRQAGEQLFGTAPRTDVWFLLEYTGRWEPEALDSALPEPVKRVVSAQLEAAAPARFGLIRRGSEPAPVPGLAFYVALIREGRPALYAFRLETMTDLLDLDLTAICAEDPAYATARTTDPLVLVCTHGRRDRCCGRAGLPVYERLCQAAGMPIWQVSHVGGHRFAANVIALPHGIYHGRVTPENAVAAIDAYRRGELHLETYRGRACYAKPVQAAEFYLRSETGIVDLDGLALQTAVQTGPDRWEIRFAETRGGQGHTVAIAAETVPGLAYLNCTDSEPSAVTQYHRVP